MKLEIYTILCYLKDGEDADITQKVDKVLSYIRDLDNRIYKARKMIFDNYGVLDKYQIELLDDILKGDKKKNDI